MVSRVTGVGMAAEEEEEGEGESELGREVVEEKKRRERWERDRFW